MVASNARPAPAFREPFSPARLGALTQVVFAGLVGAVSLIAGFGHPEPEFMPRPLVLVVVYAVIGVVAWLGIQRGRAGVVAGAALASGLGSLLAFSGVTLIFLVPASLMTAGAIAMVARGSIPSLRVLTIGFVRGALVFALLVGAGASALLLTDAACWIAHQTALGTWIEVLPYSTGEMTLAGDGTSGGCSTGVVSPRGVGLGAVLAISALGLAFGGSRRRVVSVPDQRGAPSSG